MILATIGERKRYPKTIPLSAKALSYYLCLGLLASELTEDEVGYQSSSIRRKR
jgi:hypothetical protein